MTPQKQRQRFEEEIGTMERYLEALSEGCVAMDRRDRIEALRLRIQDFKAKLPHDNV